MRTIASHSIPAVILLLIAAGIAAAPGAALAGSLTGSVRNSTGFAAIDGANVTVHVLIPDSIPFPAVTAVDGSYDITGITPGNEIYVVIAFKSGFRESYTRVADLGSQDLVFDIYLDPDTAGLPPPGGGDDSGNVAGTVYEAAGGGALLGLSGATVSLHSATGTAVAMTDPDGHYSARIPAGSFAVSVSGAGFDSLAITGLDVDSSGTTVNAVVKKTVTDVVDDPGASPGSYALGQNYPNPFNPVTSISYTLPVAGSVELTVVNALGQEVAVLVDGTEEAGRKAVSFDATGLPSGMYTCRLTAGSFTAIRRMLLVK